MHDLGPYIILAFLLAILSFVLFLMKLGESKTHSNTNDGGKDSNNYGVTLEEAHNNILEGVYDSRLN